MKDFINQENRNIYTKNMFVESHYELNISLFERELTVKMVNDAYEKILNEHMDKITKGIPNIFNIKENSLNKLTDFTLGKQRLAEFSPDGSKIAFVRNNNLFYIDLESMKEIQITMDGKGTQNIGN